MHTIRTFVLAMHMFQETIARPNICVVQLTQTYVWEGLAWPELMQ